MGWLNDSRDSLGTRTIQGSIRTDSPVYPFVLVQTVHAAVLALPSLQIIVAADTTESYDSRDSAQPGEPPAFEFLLRNKQVQLFRVRDSNDASRVLPIEWVVDYKKADHPMLVQNWSKTDQFHWFFWGCHASAGERRKYNIREGRLCCFQRV